MLNFKESQFFDHRDPAAVERIASLHKKIKHIRNTKGLSTRQSLLLFWCS